MAVISACSAYKDINVGGLQLGMSQLEVQQLLDEPVVRISMNRDINGSMEETFQVQKRIVRGGIARQQRYNLFFVDNKLVKYDKDSEKFSF